jgi:hypothetical protein
VFRGSKPQSLSSNHARINQKLASLYPDSFAATAGNALLLIESRSLALNIDPPASCSTGLCLGPPTYFPTYSATRSDPSGILGHLGAMMVARDRMVGNRWTESGVDTVPVPARIASRRCGSKRQNT